MSLLVYVTIGFLFLEAANLLKLYFFPGSRYANTVGVFKAWEKPKSDPAVHNFVKYLVNWVAGTKLIFIVLLVVILIFADERTLFFTGVALVFSIASFFWRLFLLIRKMDRDGQIEPQKYSLAQGWVIGGFILLFATEVLVSFFAG